MPGLARNGHRSRPTTRWSGPLARIGSPRPLTATLGGNTHSGWFSTKSFDHGLFRRWQVNVCSSSVDKNGYTFYRNDPFYWQAKWQVASIESVVERVDAATSERSWILDGNFDDQRDFVWQRADTVIWLDYPLWRVLHQVVKRNLGLWLSQKPTWSDNHMSWQRAWSGIHHSLRSHKLKRKNYPNYLKEFPHLRVHHFRCPDEANRWLASLSTDW